jgi:predicted amidohydrolase
MSEPVVAAVQMTSTDDVEANLERCRKLVTDAAAAGASLIGLPENFAYLGPDQDHRAALAEDLPARDAPGTGGPILTAMRQLARSVGAWLLLGGFPERAASQGATTSKPSRIRNTAVLLDGSGDLAAIYRKVHLFDVDVPGGKSFRESETVEPGAEPVVAQTPWGGLGLTICYDLRFPELYRALAARDARIIAVPSAFTMETGKDHWHVLLRARAIENQVYIVAPAQFGSHGNNRRSYGHALVIDPWGTVLAECGDHEGFALARIASDYQDKIRATFPVLRHRRF